MPPSNSTIRKLKDGAKTSNTGSNQAGQSELDVLSSSSDLPDEQVPLIEPAMAPNIHDNPVADEHADEVIKETPKRKWQSYIW
jgi:hypothetical protein